MGIGIWELLILLVLLAVIVAIIAGTVLLMVRIFGRPARAIPQRSAAERLAELEALRKADQITAAEYEKQRATILSSV